MRIGIVPVTDSARGGVYQYSLAVLDALAGIGRGGRDVFIVFADGEARRAPVGPRWETRPLTPPTAGRRTADLLRKIVGEGPHRNAWRALRRRAARPGEGTDPFALRKNSGMERWFRQCGVDLLIFPAPDKLSFESGIPYIMAVHDLQHRLQPEFPEVSADGEWEEREYLFRNGCRRAAILLADSETGREDILRFYGDDGLPADRVKVLPYLPASYLPRDVPAGERARVRARYGLPERYLFYPAQFWPHKNHVRLVRAVGAIRRAREIDVFLVLAGSREGGIKEKTFAETMAAAREAGAEGQVLSIGYVPEEDMAALYAEAAALAMPTFFGPTNIPVLEAWSLGCPVLTSDIRGIREQSGDAALLVDPRSVDSIADGILRLWRDEGLGASLADRGRRRLALYTPGDFRERLGEALAEARGRVASGRGVAAGGDDAPALGEARP